ncbi:MAG TPA: GAF domain-containing protein [Methylomirabilota bacterium]|nr:GAF domain-containing protein [Methylomirabilota bacterium]
MSGDSVRTALSQLGDALESLRERLGDGPGPARSPDRDAHALDIFQEILSVPPLGLPPGELFGLAMDRVSRLLAADRTLLFVLDDATGRLVPRSGRGFRRDDMESVVLDPGEGLVGRVFAEKRVLTYDAAAEPTARDPFVERFPMRQGIAVPVRTEGEAAGVLFAGRQDLGAPFTTTDVLLLLVIADRVGSSLVHQRLLERRGDHLAHLRELRGLVDANLPAREPREILARAADSGCRLAGVRGALALAGSGPGRVDVLAGAGLLASVGLERLRADDDVLVEGFAAEAPVAIRDLQARRPAGRPGLFEEEGIRAALLVPMRARGRVVGLLCLADPEPRDFSPEETESALMLAALAAGSLETERQLAESRHALAERDTEQVDVGRGERTRVLAALGAGLTRELHPVFATLLGRAQLLLARAPEDPLREGLVALEEAAWRGTDLLQRLLGLAEADQRGAVAELPAIAQEAVSFARARLRAEPGSRGAIEMTAELGVTPPVEAGATALREAVVALVLNAVEAMPAGGTLAVRTRSHADGAELVLVDTGEGIPSEIRPRVFDPFFTSRPGHLGLGLSVAEAVVLRAGGRLELDRAGASGGTRVTLWLPAVGLRPAPPAPEPAKPAPAATTESRAPAERTGSVLVVEEEEGIRTEVMDTLMAVGHRVEAVPDADAALARLGLGGIDVVLTDLALRDRSGLHLASAIKKRSPGTAVVLLTGWGRRLHEDRLRECGVDVMLVKPVQPDRVREAVADALTLRGRA